MEKTYAKALFSLASKEGADEAMLADRLIAHLKAEGKLKLLPKILRELRRQQQEHKTLEASVEVASDGEAAGALQTAKALGIEAKNATVNPLLIRGWRARMGGRLIDHSSSNALVELYRKITR